MKKDIDIVYSSDSGNKVYSLANGYISHTTFHFEKENVVVVIEAKGNIEIYDMKDSLLASTNAPKLVSGKEVYESIRLQVEQNEIVLEFPIYSWIDNYPHCDGEHDRWDCVIKGYQPIRFNLINKAFI